MRSRILILVLGLLAMLVVAGTAMAANPAGAVYTLSNSPAGNAVIAFDRAKDGTLALQGLYPTGGLGNGGGLGSQGAVALADNGHSLLAVNAGSASVSLFSVRPGGLTLEATVPSGGTMPISVTSDGKLVYVLNAGGTGNISGFTLKHDSLTPLAGSTRPLAGSGPAEVAFTRDGDVLVVTEKATSTIDTYVVGKDGRPGAPVSHPSSGATPFGFDFDKRGHLLVSEAAGSASSYWVGSNGSVSPISAAVPTHQAAPCWLIASRNGRFAYTANAGSGTLSGFAVGHDGSLTLLDSSGATAVLGPGSHPLDLAVSKGRFLYNLTDGFHRITGFHIEKDGSLTPVGSTGGIPAGAAGLAAS
jgi:6-phosphogluconolactonase